MASELIVPVVRLTNFREHPTAALLGLVDVLGYQMVIPLVEQADGPFVRRFQKGITDQDGRRVPAEPGYTGEVEELRFGYKYNEQSRYVYFPADTLIPAAWADRFGVRKYLKGKDNDRVGRIRLRGEPSFGLVVDLPDSALPMAEGDNLADFYGAKKYEPPIRIGCGDAAAHDAEVDPFFDKFTDIQNGRLFLDVFTEGEEVIFTEKIHGTNCRVGLIGGNLVAGSMEVRRKRPVRQEGDATVPCELDSEEVRRNLYWSPFAIPGVLALLTEVTNRGLPASSPNAGNQVTIKSVVLCGEVYGGSVQSLDYGVAKGKGLGFRAFGLRVNGNFMDWDEFKAACDRYGVATVPVLWRGPFSLAKAKELADGVSTMAGHLREGTVAYPVKERTHPKVGRAVLKYIGTEYELSKHKDRDSKDV